MIYSSECAGEKKEESKLNSVEMRMLRWAKGKTKFGPDLDMMNENGKCTSKDNGRSCARRSWLKRLEKLGH